MQYRFPAGLGASLVAVGLGLAFTASAAAAEPAGFYVRLDTGASFSVSDGGNLADLTGFGEGFGTSALIGGGVGYVLPWQGTWGGLRVDLTGNYRPTSSQSFTATNSSLSPLSISTSASVSQWAILTNLYWDIPTGTMFTPYIGAGLGVAVNTISSTTYTLSDRTTLGTTGGATTSNVAWMAAAGVSAALTDKLSAMVGYRYFDAGTVSTSDTFTVNNRLASASSGARISASLAAHELTVGLRYRF